MTENEKYIEIIKSLDCENITSITCDYKKTGCSDCDFMLAKNKAIQALEEIQQYRAIGTVERLKFLKEVCDLNGDELEHLANAVIERRKYANIGTIEEFKALKEKNEPKKVQYDEYGKEEGYPYCECGKCLIDDFVGVSYCPDCGQKLDWQ